MSARRFPGGRLRSLAVSVACAALAAATWFFPAYAEIVPTAGLADPRVRSAAYDVEQIYRLNGFAGYQIDLEFEPGESFVGLGAGDLEAVSFFAQDNHLFLKPKAAKVTTNLTVLTNRRHYQFSYVAGSRPPGADARDVIFALRFIYPSVPSAAATAGRIEADLQEAATGRRQNLDYWYCGSPVLRPVFAADDACTRGCGSPPTPICRRCSCATRTPASRCSITAWRRATSSCIALHASSSSAAAV